MEQKRNNQRPNFSSKKQTNTTNESNQYPIIPPIRIGTCRQNRNNYNEYNHPRSNEYNSNQLSIQSPNNNEPSNLPRLNNTPKRMTRTNNRCNQQQSCSNSPLYRNSNELNQQVRRNDLNPQSKKIKEPECPIISSENKSPRRNKRAKNIDNHTDQNHPKNNEMSNNYNTSQYTNVENDPWDDYTIDRSDIIDKQNCAICICDFEIDENVIKLECGHIFHKGCIIPWYDENIKSPTCPICRKNLSNFNISHLSVILGEANYLMADAISYLAEANSYLDKEISFFKQLNCKDATKCDENNFSGHLIRMKNYINGLNTYMKRNIFYFDKLDSIDISSISSIDEEEIRSFDLRLKSFLTQSKSLTMQIQPFLRKTISFYNSANRLIKAKTNEKNSNLNELNGNTPENNFLPMSYTNSYETYGNSYETYGNSYETYGNSLETNRNSLEANRNSHCCILL